jgi:hypothetical protein
LTGWAKARADANETAGSAKRTRRRIMPSQSHPKAQSV